MNQYPSTFEKLLEPVSEFIAAQDQQLKKHHNQKLDYKTFFTVLMYFLSIGPGSLKLFITTKLGLLPARLGFTSIPYSTFQEGFSRFLPGLFQAVFSHLVSTLPLKAVPEFAALGTLCCIDGSLFPVMCSMSWAAYKAEHQALKLHCCFELNRMIPIDIQITAGHASERNSLMEMAKAGVTYIADRGYMSFDLCAALIEKQAFFILRTKNNLCIKAVEELVCVLPESTCGLFSHVSDRLIRYVNDPQKQLYRLVCFTINGEVYHLVTNRLDLTTFQVIMLYAYRWQIELLFRYLKRTLNGLHLVRHDERGVSIQFYAMMIIVLLQLRLKQHILDTVPLEQPAQKFKKKKNQRRQPHSRLDAEGFLQSLGQTVSTYWKIGIHWLTVFRHLLASPFDDKTRLILRGVT
jgi:Transposase DDE domain